MSIGSFGVLLRRPDESEVVFCHLLTSASVGDAAITRIRVLLTTSGGSTLRPGEQGPQIVARGGLEGKRVRGRRGKGNMKGK